MSTNLELVASLAQEVGITTAPTSVTGQTGELKNCVDWIPAAYTEIQNKHQHWRWMRSKFNVNTVAEDDTYAYGDCTESRLTGFITRFGHWWLETDDGYSNVTSYLTSTGVSAEQPLFLLPWEAFRYRYKRGTQTSGQPVHIAIDPQNNLVLGPKPSAIYTINGEYQMSAQVLAANGDTPEMPSRFHKLIVYEAMKDHGWFSSAQEVLGRAEQKAIKMMADLESDQLPEITLGGPLA